MTLNTIHHIAIICSDKDAALRFYHDILGFPIIRSNYREGRRDWKIDSDGSLDRWFSCFPFFRYSLA